MLIIITSAFILITFLGIKTFFDLRIVLNAEINESLMFASLKKITFMFLLFVFSLTAFISIYQNVFVIQSQQNYDSLMNSSNEFVEIAEKSYILLSEVSDKDVAQREIMEDNLNSIIREYNNLISTNKQILNNPVLYIWYLGFVSPAYNDMLEVKLV